MPIIQVVNNEIAGFGNLVNVETQGVQQEIINVEVSQELYDAVLEDRATAENNETYVPKYIYSNGEIIVDPDYETKKAQKERERLDQLSLTKREVFLAIYKDKGITPETIRSQLQNTEALIEFDYSERFYRGNPLITSVGIALGYTIQQLDYLFENGEFEEE